ncbi:30S ribosomal protein S13 [Candidatus Parcubacteria bacterium]|nr:30S ribosomal protein S13 [Candidatus Parcubacteria bacterium]
MPRIAGVNIPDNKRIEIALTYIFGVGCTSSKKILAEAKIDPNVRAIKLTSEEINRLKEIIVKNNTIEGELKKDRMMAVKRLKDISCWKGMRHAKKLPVRGQRTKTNSRTVRGNIRRTVGSGRKGAPAPK